LTRHQIDRPKWHEEEETYKESVKFEFMETIPSILEPDAST
jgi:hypothetical protein